MQEVLSATIRHTSVESSCFHKSYKHKTKLKGKSLSDSKDDLYLPGTLEEKDTDTYSTLKHLS